MLRFYLPLSDTFGQEWITRNAHAIGPDSHPLRATISLEEGVLTVDRRDLVATAVALLYPVGELGQLTLQTCLLPDRDHPYRLSIELARHRLMNLYALLEEWAMFDLPQDHPVHRRAREARQAFIEALCVVHDDPAAADHHAHNALIAAIDASEELALAHAELLLERRIQTGKLPPHALGIGVPLAHASDHAMKILAGVGSLVALQCPWNALAPEEDGNRWDDMDRWVDWASERNIPLAAGPLISFETGHVPDWVYIWEHDFETIRDLIYDHVERVVTRYKDRVAVWNVVSGLHVNQNFPFSFDQVMDITRTATRLVKRIQPVSRALIGLRQPFGEYFAANVRSIPPALYADLVVQAGNVFDGFSLQILMGQAQPGQFCRDLMQLATLIDRYGALGKPLQVVIGVPSSPVTSEMINDTDSDLPADSECGIWRRPWNATVQGHWLEAVTQIAASRPFVETVLWKEVVDHPDMSLPLAGLLAENLEPKPAAARLLELRKRFNLQPQQPA
ncbi:endo-1,4-beta-xylanase [Mucisphaera calidilacus]|uniref:Glycosyl hydrolase family 10 n=1 Tax=Mucisphaera calidilacus TaxID=2527982 RepID=A0A518BY99_9BACT|nr:endo-1,4-beta-xylanase [Mucisphaera calidilacus]QDU71953.1 Glycosyl hydrolase family 10 [Mucisphaera calidilacus]